MIIQSIWPQVKQLIEDSGENAKILRSHLKDGEFDSKSDKSLVTSIDKETEQRLITGLRDILPGSDFLAEEGFSLNEEKELTWIIDPIDGTTNLVHNVPAYCISVALRKNGKTILGVVYEISRKELFYALDGMDGAFLNNERIQVSSVRSLNEALIGTGFPVSAFDKIDDFIHHFRYFMLNTHGIRRGGSAALDLAYVACGRFDGFFEYNLSPWDVAGGAYIVEKAGGKVSDFNGGNDYIYGRRIIAGNKEVHSQLLNKLQKN